MAGKAKTPSKRERIAPYMTKPWAGPATGWAYLVSVLGQNQILMTHIAPLHRQAILNSLIPLGSNLHAIHLTPKFVDIA